MLGKAQLRWADTQARDLKKSDILEWLASLRLGTSCQNPESNLGLAAYSANAAGWPPSKRSGNPPFGSNVDAPDYGSHTG
jgi:hypothetical protein